MQYEKLAQATYVPMKRRVVVGSPGNFSTQFTPETDGVFYWSDILVYAHELHVQFGSDVYVIVDGTERIDLKYSSQKDLTLQV